MKQNPLPALCLFDRNTTALLRIKGCTSLNFFPTEQRSSFVSGGKGMVVDVSGILDCYLVLSFELHGCLSLQPHTQQSDLTDRDLVIS